MYQSVTTCTAGLNEFVTLFEALMFPCICLLGRWLIKLSRREKVSDFVITDFRTQGYDYFLGAIFTTVYFH